MLCKYPEKTLSQEDGACPSANYMHIGKGKFWTVVKPDFTKKLEQELAIELNWPEEKVICYLRRNRGVAFWRAPEHVDVSRLSILLIMERF